ncbi:hypothetical protein [Microbacterium kyungheense]|uniref:hypothetical protein n=1 Tax=Microbacterium kyungheense TaxID=1263636 RepID=UPI001152BB9A|nr:hypothetical protein [Microbacterium kyungheense]
MSAVTHALCDRIVRTQLVPDFGKITIREITAERIEHHLAVQRIQSEKAAAHSREVIELLLDFAAGEGVIISNPMGDTLRNDTPPRFGDLDTHREIVRGRIALRREERLREAGPGPGRPSNEQEI